MPSTGSKKPITNADLGSDSRGPVGKLKAHHDFDPVTMWRGREGSPGH